MTSTQDCIPAPIAAQRAIRCVDCDVHNAVGLRQVLDFLPEPWKTQAARGGMHGHLGYFNPIGVTRSDTLEADGKTAAAKPEGIARMLLDPYEIDIAVLTGGVYGSSCHPDPDYAAAVCRAYNDFMLERFLPGDERLRLAINLSTRDPLLAAREVERLAGHPKVVAAVTSSASWAPLGQRIFHPLYAACEKAGLPLMIHPGNEGTGVTSSPNPAGYPTRYLEWHTDLACQYIGQLVSFVCEGVFQKFPAFKLVLVEGGVSWLPPLLWRFDKNWKALRSTVPWLDRRPSEVIAEHCFLTTQPIEEPDEHRHLKQIFEMFPAEKMLMFASDFPHWDGDTPNFALKGFGETFRRRVLAGNAVELFGLESGA